MRHDSKVTIALVALVALGVACRKAGETTEKPKDDFDESAMESGGARSQSEDDRLDQLYGKRIELAPRPAQQEQCEGSGAERRCTKVDPDPKLAAAWGVREHMGQFRWGMDPKTVLTMLTEQTKAEHERNASSDALKQDASRRALEAELAELPKQHVEFDTPAGEIWRTTAVAKMYSEKAGEEMVWYGVPTDRYYYMFADGKLWAILHALGKARLPGKTYDMVLEAVLKKSFGSGVADNEVRDKRSSAVLVRYGEWESQSGETVRAYDLLEAHGVILVAVVAPSSGERAQRHPDSKVDPAFKGGEDLDKVLEESGICYDENGDMIHDPKRCKAQQQKAEQQKN